MGLVKLDSEIKGECGNINIPFGYADVFTLDNQPDDDNKSLYISVKPKVYTCTIPSARRRRKTCL